MIGALLAVGLAGAAPLTVIMCPTSDSACDARATAMAEHLEASGNAWVLLADLLDASRGGDAALQDWERAITPADRVAALTQLPFTVSNEELFALFLLRADATDNLAERTDFLDRALSVAGPRVADLPPLSEPVLGAWLDRCEDADRSPGAILRIDGPRKALAFIDGVSVGPVPAEATVRAGWHRISVETSGQRRAWIGEVTAAPDDTLRVGAGSGADAGMAADHEAILAATNGHEPPSQLTADLVQWAVSHDVEALNIAIADQPAATAAASACLDVASQRWKAGTCSVDRAPARWSAGARAGYQRLGARNHAVLSVPVRYRTSPAVAWELRAGIQRSAEPYVFKLGQVDFLTAPVAIGPRLGSDYGPWVSAQALAVIPYAVGTALSVGWSAPLQPGLSIDVEARGQLTDKALGAAVLVGLTGRRR